VRLYYYTRARILFRSTPTHDILESYRHTFRIRVKIYKISATNNTNPQRFRRFVLFNTVPTLNTASRVFYSNIGMDKTQLFIKAHVLMKLHQDDEVRGKHIRYLIIK